MASKRITYNKLRFIKDSLPAGAMQRIADDLNIDINQVRCYFGANDTEKAALAGFHVEPGPDGGIVLLDSREILDHALQLLREELDSDILD